MSETGIVNESENGKKNDRSKVVWLADMTAELAVGRNVLGRLRHQKKAPGNRRVGIRRPMSVSLCGVEIGGNLSVAEIRMAQNSGNLLRKHRELPLEVG